MKNIIQKKGKAIKKHSPYMQRNLNAKDSLENLLTLRLKFKDKYDANNEYKIKDTHKIEFNIL